MSENTSDFADPTKHQIRDRCYFQIRMLVACPLHRVSALSQVDIVTAISLKNTIWGRDCVRCANCCIQLARLFVCCFGSIAGYILCQRVLMLSYICCL